MHDIQVLNDIYKTLKKSIRIDAKPIRNGRIQFWKSHFGGTPYIPKGMEYPRNSDGSPLYLLAQINFIDVPHLEHFPESGFLQFYISDKNGYGVLDDSYKVVYIPHTRNYDNQSDLNFLNTPENFPVQHPYLLSFSLSRKPLPVLNNNFTEVFSIYNESKFSELYDSIIDSYNPHQIGGWASFAQNSPDFININNDYEVLLQIDSIDGISFGYGGIATFFIKKEDLQKMDFSKIKFYWSSC